VGEGGGVGGVGGEGGAMGRYHLSRTDRGARSGRGIQVAP
jgi:hypothetical protein